ncbi:unnamed protein product, partial [Rodentolepis nana]|uniref:CBF domain-containing protein n=1 Tax=Rodentolepis nana TaxID=102285 RepID=A0A0R3T620_RODNA
YTNLKAEIPENINVALQVAHAKNIFEKYFVVDKMGSLVNTNIYGGNDRFIKEWLAAILHRGTSTDRVLALGYMIREKPLSSLRHIESLLTLISPVKKQLCIKAIEVLADLFETTLLPTKRSLIPFSNRPFSTLSKYQSVLTEELSLKDSKNGADLPTNCQEHILGMWYFEDAIKKYYRQYLTALEKVLLSETFEGEKSKALNAIMNLISKKPECRDIALGIVVNKLGDRSKGFVSKVNYKLRLLCQKYSNLKAVLVEQLRVFLFRPNLLERAKYYAIVFLSCIPLSKNDNHKLLVKDEDGTSDSSVAAVLFKLYLSFFCASIKADELPERLIAALLTGICRVSPFISSDVLSDNVKDINAVFKLVHITSNFTISLQALNFLFQLTVHQPTLRDRFYQALYRKLADPSIRWSARLPTLLKLVYQSIQADTDVERKAAFAQRLLSVALNHPNSGFVAGSLILLEKVRLECNVDVIGSLTQEKVSTEDPGILLPKSIGMVKPSHHENDANVNSDEEYFSDAPGSDDDEGGKKTQDRVDSDVFAWEHKNVATGKRKKLGKTTSAVPVIGYDDTARDPRFARAFGQPCWSLQLLAAHAHPTVAHFAQSLQQKKAFKYQGDPFEDLSVAHFMERFIYKKPKSTTSAPLPGKISATTVNRKKVHAKTLAPDSLAYKNLKTDQVPSDERFIHSYFNFIDDHPAKRVNKDDEDGSDLDEDFDQYLRKHERGLIPDDIDDDEIDEDIDYSTDEEEENEEDADDKNDDDDADFDEELEDLSDDASGVGDEDSDGDFDAMSDDKHNKSDKFDMNKLFVSADEIGNLYDNQEEDGGGAKGQRKWKNKHGRPGLGKRKYNAAGGNKFTNKRKFPQSKNKNKGASKFKKPRRG